MPDYRIHVFISHSWTYSGHYDTLYSWLFDHAYTSNGSNVRFSNYSVPKDSPIHNARTIRELQDAIYQRIARASVVVIPTGMYANYSKWIQREIDGSVEYTKPILAVNPWGQRRRSSVVAEAATSEVGWNRMSVARGVWDLYRA